MLITVLFIVLVFLFFKGSYLSSKCKIFEEFFNISLVFNSWCFYFLYYFYSWFFDWVFVLLYLWFFIFIKKVIYFFYYGWYFMYLFLLFKFSSRFFNRPNRKFDSLLVLSISLFLFPFLCFFVFLSEYWLVCFDFWVTFDSFIFPFFPEYFFDFFYFCFLVCIFLSLIFLFYEVFGIGLGFTQSRGLFSVFFGGFYVWSFIVRVYFVLAEDYFFDSFFSNNNYFWILIFTFQFLTIIPFYNLFTFCNSKFGYDLYRWFWEGACDYSVGSLGWRMNFVAWFDDFAFIYLFSFRFLVYSILFFVGVFLSLLEFFYVYIIIVVSSFYSSVFFSFFYLYRYFCYLYYFYFRLNFLFFTKVFVSLFR